MILRLAILVSALTSLSACGIITKPEACGPLYGIARLGPVGDVQESGRSVQNIDGIVYTTFGIQERYYIDRASLDFRTHNGDIVDFRVDRGALDKYGGLDWGPRAYDVTPCKLPRSAARRILSRSEYDRYEREGRFD